MTRRTGLVLLAVLVALLAGAFAWRQVPSRRAATVTPAGAAASSAAAVLELAPADLVEVRMRPLTRAVTFTGSLKPVQSAILKAKVAGELLALTPREGDSVRAGEVVGRIDPTEFDWRLKQAEQQVAVVRAQRDITLRQLQNNRALVEQGFISPTALDTALANDNAAMANLAAAQAAAELARKAQADALLRAPISGQVAQRLVQPGERVAVDARVLEIVDLSRLELEAALPPEEAAVLAPGASARLWVEGRAEPVAATVLRINPSAQAGTRAVLAYLGLRGAPGLRAGLFARGEIALARTAAAPVASVPVSAVRVDASRPYVIAFENGRVQHRRVLLGARGTADEPGAAEPYVELREGIAAGTPVLRGSLGLVADGAAARLGASPTSPTAPASPRAPAPAASAASR